jgi:hypothetical protein
VQPGSALLQHSSEGLRNVVHGCRHCLPCGL